MSKKPKSPREPDPDSAHPLSREDMLMRAFQALIDDQSPLMVTGWVTLVEYVDNDGDQRLAAYSSNLPPWRLNGIIETGHEMLLEEYDYEDD